MHVCEEDDVTVADADVDNDAGCTHPVMRGNQLLPMLQLQWTYLSDLHGRRRLPHDIEWCRYVCYQTLPAGWMMMMMMMMSRSVAIRQTPSAEATAWAQCTTPTDLKVGRTFKKALANFKRRNQWIFPAKNPTKSCSLQECSFREALAHCNALWSAELYPQPLDRGDSQSPGVDPWCGDVH